MANPPPTNSPRSNKPYAVPFTKGPFRRFPQLKSGASPSVRLSQQYTEVVHSGSDPKIRLSQQYTEVVQSGGNTKIRLSQQYIEVIVNFGQPPPNNGKGKAPGQGKKPPKDVTALWLKRLRFAEARKTWRFMPNAQVYASPGFAYVPQVPPPYMWRDRKHVVTVGTSSRAVRTENE